MNKGNTVVWIVVALLVIFGLYAWVSSSGDESVMMNDGRGLEEEESVMSDHDKSDMEQMEESSYLPYSEEKLALADDGDVVLFFHASWCPTCRVLDANIRGNLDKIPQEVTILNVDYDNSTALKRKYGVTYQHTLVQVDSSGDQITKWSSSPTLSALLREIK